MRRVRWTSCSRISALRLFTDKGIYPVETVWSVFCVTSNLTRAKFDADLKLLRTLPLHRYSFYYRAEPEVKCVADGTHTVARFDAGDYCHRRSRYGTVRCIFGFNGTINEQWADELNSMLTANAVQREHLPDIVVVNKVGMIYGDQVSISGREYEFEDFQKTGDYLGRLDVSCNVSSY